MRTNAWLWPILALSLAAFGCGSSSNDDMGPGGDDMGEGGDDMGGGSGLPPILEAVVNDPELSSLAAAVAEMIERDIIDDTLLAVLGGLSGPTLFAPTNPGFDAALAALGIEDVTTASDEDLEALLGIIAYHFHAGTLTAADITALDPPTAPSIVDIQNAGPNGETVKLYFDTSDGVAVRYITPFSDPAFQEAAATVTAADEDVPGDEDAVIHKVDNVIVPPDVAAVAELEGLTGLITAINAAAPVEGVPVRAILADPTANYTVFAPSNAAFDALPQVPPAEQLTGILLYHVLAGEAPVFSDDLEPRFDTVAELTMILDGTDINGGSGGDFGGAGIVATDIVAANGVAHVIDAVLIPPTAGAMAGIAGLTSLVGAIQASSMPQEILGVLTDPTEALTVLAPTNTAFDNIPGGAPTDPDLLTNVLLYHVTQNGVVALSTDFEDGDPVPTRFEGAPSQPVANVDGTSLTFTDAAAQTITPVEGLFDIRVANGVVHVVDTVLLPIN